MRSRINKPQTDKELLSWLRLIRTESVGPVTFYKLLDRFGSAGDAIDNLPDLSKQKGKKTPINLYPIDYAEKELESLNRFGGKLITVKDSEYPLTLSSVYDAPPVLSVIGKTELLNSRCIGIVGSRNASYNGRKFTHKICTDLGEMGFTVVSGMARGIDTAAHKGSIQSGTIAVIAGGINNIYPQENKDLHAEICEKGVVVSETPFGFDPRPQDFPRRNRIISGMSEGVAVIEASLRSGSLITARVASEQGKEVFAVPGFPFDPRAQGTNKLIKEGATLIQNAEDIYRALSEFNFGVLRDVSDRDISDFRKQGKSYYFENQSVYGNDNDDFLADDDLETNHQELQACQIEDNDKLENPVDIIANILSHVPVELDEIVQACNLTAQEVQALLLEMELEGVVDRYPGGKVSLAVR